MSLCTMHFAARSLGKETALNVILPEGRGPFPVLYLLHGLSDDFTAWQRYTSIERYAAPLGMIVVMPDGHRSFYTNDPRGGGLAYEDHIVRDVVDLIDGTFPTIRRRTGRAIAGLSMGGYGATMLALRHPELYSVACSHSGALFFTHQPSPTRPAVNYYSEVLGHRKYDIHTLARKFRKAGHKLAYRMDCGTEDSLLEANREFHCLLEKLGMSHEYAEFPGGHNWAYWDAHVQETLAFVKKHLTKARTA